MGKVKRTGIRPGVLVLLAVSLGLLVAGSTAAAAPTAVVGSGPGFQAPTGIAVEASGDLVVTDNALDAVLRVDPVTGDRTIVSDAGTGAGPAFGFPRAIAVEASGDLVVTDPALDAVVRVDPVTGDRVIVSEGLPEEACCFPDGTCAELDAVDCIAQGGVPGGAGSVCLGMQACCDPGGYCYMADASCCLDNGDTPQGPGTVCIPNLCGAPPTPPPTPPPAVGGVTEVLIDSSGSPASAAEGPGSSAPPYAAIAGSLAAAALAVAAGAWYARRLWLR